MKIAIIGSGIYSAPRTKGRIHAPLELSFELAKQLARMGHYVKFFGIINPRFRPSLPFEYEDFGYKESFSKVKDFRLSFFAAFEQGFIIKALENAKNFDVIYYFMPFRIGPFAMLMGNPIVGTHHDSTHMEEYNPMYSSFANQNLYLIPISKYSKKRLKYPNYLDIVYNGVEPQKIPFKPTSLEYFCWVGRVSPSKGLHVAIKLAKKLKFHLKIVGPMETYPDQRQQENYFEKIKEEIKKNKNIEYLGLLNRQKTLAVIATSKGLIFPSDGVESCPMTVIEAMVAGVPVIGSALGPLPELIATNKTGFLCKDFYDFEKAVKKVDSFDRKKCRQIASEKFSLEEMARGYEKQFQKAIKIHKNLSKK